MGHVLMTEDDLISRLTRENDANPAFTYAVTLKNAEGKRDRRHYNTRAEAVQAIATIGVHGEWTPTGIQGYIDGKWRYAEMDNMQAARIVASALSARTMEENPLFGQF